MMYNTHDEEVITKFSPVVSTENIGDVIIDYYCNSILNGMFHNPFYILVPTREKLSTVAVRSIVGSKYSFVIGTNLLSCDMKNNSQWVIGSQELRTYSKFLNANHCFLPIRNMNLVLFGVGWHSYQQKTSQYSSYILNNVLSKEIIHSVRDQYSVNKLKEIGITNVVNTSCPTMWNLTEEHCSKIPKKKAKNVVTTITDYSKNIPCDNYMLDVLSKNYETVYLWKQSYRDTNYLKELIIPENTIIISASLKEYDRLLNTDNIDYVGTRLHGGIYALNKKKRSIIIAIDNRAKEINETTNLPIVNRENIFDSLDETINNSFSTNIKLPTENIELWKKQFK